jgi:signal transduction histidine kinase/DNA-binding response OmpR family regulator/ligand-binding sensor domain-containing protein
VRSRRLLIAALLSLSPALQAAELAPGWSARQWTVDQGLPLNHITDLAQTPDGYLWIATFDGLVRFDGQRFRTYRAATTPGLPSDRFTELEVDRDGVLWALTEEGALTSRSDRAFQAWELEVPLRSLTQIDGTLWASSADGPLVRWEDGAPAPWRAGEISGDSAPVGAGGTLWTTEGDQLVQVSPNGDVYRWPVPGPPQATLAAGGELFVAYEGGVARLVGDHLAPLPWDMEDDTAVCELSRGSDGTLWARTSSGWAREVEGRLVALEQGAGEGCRPGAPHSSPGERGQWRLMGQTALLDERALLRAGVTLTSHTPDAEGGLWLGTLGEGLYHLRPAPLSVVSEAEGLPGPNVRSLATDSDGGLWAAVASGGELTRWRGGAARRFPAPPIEHLSVLVDHSGDTWLGYLGGLCRAGPEGCEPAPPAPLEGLSPVGLYEHGGILVSTDLGLLRLDPDSATWDALTGPDGAPIRMARAALTAPDGALLVGSASGLFRIDGERSERLGRARGLSSERLRGLSLGEGGVIWIGTEGGGLCRLALGGGGALAEAPLACIGSDRGLPADTIHAAVEDGLGRLWMSTNQGVAVAGLAAVEAAMAGAGELQVLLLDERDGMRSREANGTHHPAYARGPDGRIWFPTQDGAVSVAPETFSLPQPPAVELSEITISGAPVSPLSDGDFEPDQRDLDVSVTAPEFRWPEQLRFRYRLEGYDEGWSAPTEARRRAWTNLPPGDFTLQVQAGLAGSWSAPTTFRFRRAPAFVETGWFYLSIALAAAAVLGAGARVRLQQLRRRQQELEQLVAARTAELAARAAELSERNAQIQAQAARLREVDALKTQFVANISHELRTPVSLISEPLSELLEGGGALSPGERRGVGRALRNAERLRELIEQMLDIARLDDDGLPLRARRQDLGAFLRRVSERFAERARQRGVTLRVETPAAPAWLYFDPDLIDKVLSNLLSNALKFTAAGQITARLVAGEDDARIEIDDTGPGVPEAARPRLFDRFYQVDGSATRAHGGAGIGLSLARELVALHGGEIGAQEAPGGGSRFWFTLPTGAAHLTPEEIDTAGTSAQRDGGLPALEAPPEAPVGGRRPVVVLAEDHPDMRAYLVEHLQTRFEVYAAADGAAALEAARQLKPAAVISDVMMPEIDGLTLCRRLREDPALAGTPVLLVSARASEQDRVDGLELADDYLTKPFRIRELIARAQRLVLRQPAERDAGAPAPAPDEAGRAPADQAFLERLERVTGAHLSDRGFGVAELAARLGLSSRQLQRELTRLLDQRPKDYLREQRMTRARGLLRQGHLPGVSEVADAVGMSPSYFSRVYAAWAGYPPSEEPAAPARR